MTNEEAPMEIVLKYFPEVTDQQRNQFAQLYDLYQDWNAKINVISRKDIDTLYERHVLHSLAIAKFIHFAESSSVLDVGTGGGFPGIPLAVIFPNVHFTLIDSIGKKIRVATDVANHIGLKNITLLHENVKGEKHTFDFVVSRAVMAAPELVALVRKNISNANRNPLPNGVICLKGGDLTQELATIRYPYQIVDLPKYFEEPFFETKKLLYLSLK